MNMYISESPVQLHNSTVRSNAVTDDVAASESASIAVEEVTQSYEKYQKAKEKRQVVLLAHNAQDPLSQAAQTAIDEEETALWLFETAVRKKGYELPGDQLAFYNQVIGSATSSATSEDTFSTNSTNSTNSYSDAYINAHKRAAEAAWIRLQSMKMLNGLSKSVEALRTAITKFTETYKGDATGQVVNFTVLKEMIEGILLSNDGMKGVPGNGIIKDRDGNNLNFKDQAAADKYAATNLGPLARAKEEPPGSGQWVVTLDVQAVKEIQALFEKMEALQKKNGQAKGQDDEGYLTDDENASMQTALRGIFAGWDGTVTTASQLSSQHQQGFDTLNKLLSTLMSNDHDEISKILSRIN